MTIKTYEVYTTKDSLKEIDGKLDKLERMTSEKINNKYFIEPLSREIWKKKYKSRDDKSIFDTWKRIALFLSQVEKDKDKWFLVFFNLLEDFKFLPAGRIQVGSDPKKTGVTLLNCFMSSKIDDSINGIMDVAKESAIVQKMGGGIGYNFSTIRPNGSEVKSIHSTASGPVSFMHIFDSVCSTISSAGNRRGAQMGMLRIDHPDIELFIDAKQGTELGSQLTNFNLSVQITNEFMEAVKNNKNFDLVFNGKVYKTVNARELWSKIIKHTYDYAEPGVFFIDTANDYNNLYYIDEEEIAGTNPCFTGDTLVAVADGGNPVPIKRLAEDGNEFFVYSAKYNKQLKDWIIDVKRAKAFYTGRKKIITVKLSNGSLFRCTPDHLIAVKDKDMYIKAIESQNVRLCNWNKREIYVTEIIDNNEYEDVYDISVEDNHNFFIITKSSDDSLNPTGILVHNCGEIPLPYNGSCLLGSFNLTKYVDNPFTREAMFDFDRFVNDIPIAVRMMDNVIDVSKFPMKAFEGREKKSRRLGLGVTGYADTLLMLGLRYGSKKALQFTESLLRIMRETAFIASINLAKEKGPMSYTQNKNLRKKYVNGKFVSQLSKEIKNSIEEHGIRNSHLLSIAPTGCVIPSTKIRTLYNNEMTMEDIFKLNGINLKDYEDKENLWFEPKKEIYVKTRKGYKRITKLYINGKKPVIEIITKTGRTLVGTYNHKILNRQTSSGDKTKWVRLDKIRRGYTVVIDDNFVMFLDNVKDIRRYEAFTVDIEVEEQHEYILANGIVSHNTISLLSNNVSSGLEPVFSNEYERRIRTVGNKEEIKKVRDYAYNIWVNKFGNKKLPSYWVLTKDITIDEHLNTQAVFQKYIDNSISKTINIPSDYPFEDFKKVYEKAWELGLKGVTTFRPTKNVRGVLIDKGPKEDEKKESSRNTTIWPNNDRILQRPEILYGTTYKLKTPKSKYAYYITINDIQLPNGKKVPFEIFINTKNTEHQSWITALTRVISAVFRKGDDPSFLLEELWISQPNQGYFDKDGEYIPSIIAGVSKILRIHLNSLGIREDKRSKKLDIGTIPIVVQNGDKEIVEHKFGDKIISSPDGEQLSLKLTIDEDGNELQICPECHTKSLKISEGCAICLNCGYSRCT